MYFEHKRESYFNNRMNFIIEKEEEKNINLEDEKTEKNIILNKTLSKPIKTLSFFNNNLVSNNISHISINNQLGKK